MKIVNKLIIITTIVVLLMTPSCTKYLDVVPDNVLKLEDIYATRDDAWNGLAKAYSYMPRDWSTHSTAWELGDEFIGRIDPAMQDGMGNLPGERIMRGLQATGGPMLDYWCSSQTGTGNGATLLYEGIRNTSVFLDNIGKTPNMTETERADWIAQVKFLKAYYNFLLIRSYGPIVISDKAISPDALGEDLFLYRSKVDDCFNYVIKLIDEALPNLPTFRSDNDLGMIDRVGAQAIKARILLYRASPFYSGNREFFEDFVDPRDGLPFFPMDDPATTKAKWQDALTAVNEAITLAQSEGHTLYTFDPTKEFYVKDREFAGYNYEQVKKLYDLRFVVVEPWNKELLWGMSNIDVYNEGELAHSTNIRLSAASGIAEGDKGSSAFSWQWLGATYRMAERYYTKNGLPIDEDLTFNYNARYDIFTTPGAEDSLEYMKYAGIMQPNVATVKMYDNREMRFYANLDITGGWVRSHFEIIPVLMMQGTSGGYEPGVGNGSTDFFCTGLGTQKLVHPESRSSNWQRQVKFPYPIIRMADLYLMKAEILNEVLDAPNQEVWDNINIVRARAGIPTVEQSWGDPALAKNPNKHTTQAGMRDIILRERSIELAFEGSRFWDMQRTKRAHLEFASSIQGWDYTGTSAATFFKLKVVQARRFTIRDYLWPISLAELNTNGNLVQNPGW